MAEKANGFTLEIAKADSSSGVYPEVKGLKELNIPSLQKESIDLTNFDQSVRTFMGGVIDYGELNFKTDFYDPTFNFSNFPSTTHSYLNHVHDEIDVNGTFADTDEGHLGDSGWREDTGGGFSIISGTPNKAHLDLGDDSTDPSYARRFNVFGANTDAVLNNVAYSLYYQVTEVTGTDPQFRWEYASGSSVYYNNFTSQVIPSTVGTHFYSAMMDKAPHLNVSMRGSGQTNSITFTNVKLYKLYTWQQLFLNDIELTCRIKDPSGSVRFSFNGFLSGCEIDTPTDGIIEHNITLKVSGAVGYA